MEAPLSVTLIDGPNQPPVDLAIKSDAIFTTAVGHSSKRTLAVWHVTTPQEIVDHMLGLVNGPESELTEPKQPEQQLAPGEAEKSNL